MRRLVLLALLLLALFVPAAASATDLSAVLGDLRWGDSSEAVIQAERERILADYRTSIAGLNDPLEIDRIRRASDERVEAVRRSVEAMDAARTGYEVSVIGGEVRGASGQALMMLRDGVTTRYLLFENDRLAKYMVVYDQASLDFIGFEGFIERLGQLFGPPSSSDYEANDIGVRMLVRVLWEDGVTRLRVVDRSRMFASYLLVYSDASRPDEVHDVGATTRATRPSGGRNLGDMVRRLESDGVSSSRDHEDVVDQITGRTVTVDLTRGLVPAAADEESESSGERRSALDEDDELEDRERRSRPSRSNTRRGTSTTSDDDEGEGLTIY